MKINPYITTRCSKIHGRGVFAKRAIKKFTRIIEYVGEKITKSESDRRADIPLGRHKKDRSHGAVYNFELNKRHDIDGNVPYNTARHINHSCEPNCEVEIIRGKIWIIARRDIKKGEEVAYNYGYDYENEDEHPCHCRTGGCVGYIVKEDHWPRLKRDIKKGTFKGAINLVKIKR